MLTNRFFRPEIRNPDFSGISVTREMMAGSGLTLPLFESDRGRDEFVAHYYFHHLLGADDVAWLGRFRDLHLTDDEARAMIVAREAGAINNAAYCELTQVDANAASVALRRLRDADALVQQGRGSATYYVPGPRMLEASSNFRGGRNPEYLRQHYVQPLLRRGLVTMARLEEPNSPQQAYRAVAKQAGE